MTQPLTEELLNELLFTDNLISYIDNKIPEPLTLSQQLNMLLEQNGMKKSEVIKSAQINTTFGYQIFSGERKAGRNTLLQLAFGLKLTLLQTQRLLKCAEHAELYCKVRRDAIIMHCISQGLTLAQTEETLYRFNESTICGE